MARLNSILSILYAACGVLDDVLIHNWRELGSFFPIILTELKKLTAAIQVNRLVCRVWKKSPSIDLLPEIERENWLPGPDSNQRPNG